MDLRIPPWEKPRPDNFPKNDPMSVFLPLYDSYAGPERSSNMSNPRLSPIVSEIENLPPRMLMVVPSIDILVHEQLTMAERVSREIKEKGLDEERSCEARIVEGAFHGWLELPYLPADLRAKKDEAFGMAIDHLRDIHQRNGWHWSPE
jgi:acetyl esterase/lipase